jgi:hypothetical protein
LPDLIQRAPRTVIYLTEIADIWLESPAEVIVGGGFEILQLGGSQEEVQKKSQLGTTQ